MDSTIIGIDWTKLKVLIAAKSPSLQYLDEGNAYVIWFDEILTRFECHIVKADPVPDPSDQKDFEDNYKGDCNKASGARSHAFAVGAFEAAFDAANGVCEVNSSSNIDYKLTEKLYLNGGDVAVINNEVGDWIKCLVIDIDNVLGQGANFIVKTWVIKRFISPTGYQSVRTPYAGGILKDLYLRLIYNTTSSGSQRKVGINYDLHRKI